MSLMNRSKGIMLAASCLLCGLSTLWISAASQELSPSALDVSPTMADLFYLPVPPDCHLGSGVYIIDRIGPMYAEIGIVLLEDQYGNRLKIIEMDYRHINAIVSEIFRRWLQGAGKLPVTWKTLISTLRMVRMSRLADEILAVFACYDNDIILEKQTSPNVDFLSFMHRAGEQLSKWFTSAICLVGFNTSLLWHPVFTSTRKASDSVINQGSPSHVQQYYQNLFHPLYDSLKFRDIPIHSLTIKDKTSNMVVDLQNQLTEIDSKRVIQLFITDHHNAGYDSKLLQYFAANWTSGGGLLQSCQVLLLIHLKSLKHDSIHSLRDLLNISFGGFLDQDIHQQLVKNITTRDGAGACFLLIGYDEWDQKDYVFDLIFGNLLQSSICITASITPHDHIIGKKATTKHIEIVGVPILINVPPNLVIIEKNTTLLHHISGTYTERLSTALLNDELGNKWVRIEVDKPKEEGRVKEIFKQWLNNEGKTPVTWYTLIKVLTEIEMPVLAEDLERSIDSNVLNASALSYAHSEPIMNVANALKEYYKSQPLIDIKRLHHASNTRFLNVLVDDKNSSEVSTLWSLIDELDHDKARRLLITGHPGAGKTTLMRHLTKEWAERRILYSCQILIEINLDFLKLGDRQTFTSLSDLLSAAIGDFVKDIQSVVQDITVNQGAGACFIIDAYDEWNHNDYVTKMFFHNKLNSSHCIMASRPYDFRQITGIKHIKIVGFKLEDLKGYLNLLSLNNRTENAVLEIWKTYPKVKEVCTLPLHLAMLIAVVEDDSGQTIKTRTQIYSSFLDLTITHHCENIWSLQSLRECVVSSPTQYYNANMCNAFKKLHDIAFQIIFDKKIKFPKDHEVEESVKKLGIVNTTVVGLSKTEIIYTFSHPTFLEFFAALHLVTLSQEEQLEIIRKWFADKDSQSMIWSFFFGLLDDFYPKNMPWATVLRYYASYFKKQPLQRLSTKVCGFNIEAPLIHVLQEIGKTGQALNNLLQSAEIKKDSSLCVSQTIDDHVYIRDLLNDTNITTFQFTIRTPDGLRNLSFTLENHTNTLAEEYSKLMKYLSHQYTTNNSTGWITFPSVVTLSANTSDIEVMELHRFSNLRFLYLSLDQSVDGEKLKVLTQLTNLQDVTVHIQAIDCDRMKKSLFKVAIKLDAFSFKCI